MAYTPNNNTDFNNAISYYFGDTETLPGGTNVSEYTLGRFIEDKEILFTMQNSLGKMSGGLIINGNSFNPIDISNDLIFYPPFYDTNSILKTIMNGVFLISGIGCFIDLTKPIKITSDTTTFFVFATSIGQLGNTYDATFLNNVTINIVSKPKPVIGNWQTFNISYMSNAFNNRTTFNENIGNWNVSNVTNMAYMFNGASSFNQYIGDWNVSNVTNMAYMFNGASSFNQYIGDWNVSNVINMENMFNGTSSFNQNLGSWNVGNVTNMAYMFYGTPFNYDIGGWNVDNVNDMSYMFANNTTFDQLIRGWNVDNMVNLDSMFAGATAMLYHYIGTMYFGATPSYLYFNFIHDPFYKPSKDCSLPGNSLGDGESTRCPVKPEYKQLDTGGNDPKFNPAYAYALYVRGSLGRPGYQQFAIGNRQLNSVGSYEGAPGNGVRAPPRNKFN